MLIFIMRTCRTRGTAHAQYNVILQAVRFQIKLDVPNISGKKLAIGLLQRRNCPKLGALLDVIIVTLYYCCVSP